MREQQILMRVSIVHPHVFCGGAEKLIIYLAYFMEKMGVETEVITLSVDLTGLPDIACKVKYVTPSVQMKPISMPR